MRQQLTLIGALVLACVLAPSRTVAQPALIVGVVEDSVGRAIPDVQVLVVGRDTTWLSDARGAFRLGPLRVVGESVAGKLDRVVLIWTRS